MIAVCDREVLVSDKVVSADGHLPRFTRQQSRLDVRLVLRDKGRYAVQGYDSYLEYLGQYRRETSGGSKLAEIDSLLLYIFSEISKNKLIREVGNKRRGVGAHR